MQRPGTSPSITTARGIAPGRPAGADAGWSRPIGVSPGAGILVAAWVAAGAIARLTGAPAVIALMAALAVVMMADALSGWLAARHIAIDHVIGPAVIDVGEDARLSVEVVASHHRRGARLTLIDPRTGDRVCIVELDDDWGDRATGTIVTTGRFTTPGQTDALGVDVEVPGALGLTWWRRPHRVAVDVVNIAPLAGESTVAHDRTSSPLDGSTTATRANHVGDVDGVRPWREGEPATAVHWPSSLRAGSLIVHDRTATSDELWTVDLDRIAVTANTGSDLRRTLDNALRGGHTVSVVAAGNHDRVAGDRDAASWAALMSQRHLATESPPARPALLRRQIHTARRSVETRTTVEARSRWAAAAAAMCALATLVGALAWSPTLIAMLAAAITLGSAVSLHLARRSGRRPVMLQVAIAVAVVGALGAIAIDARDIGGLLEVLRGPMPNLLMLLVVLHGFEVVDRRTLRAHQAITFIVVAYAAGLRIDDALGWWLVAWGTAFSASLWLTPGRGPSRPRRTRPVSAVRPIAWLSATAAMTLAVLSIVPIPDGPARLGLPALSNDALTVASPGALAGPDGAPSSGSSRAGDRGRIGNVVGYPGFTDTLDTSIRGDLGDDVVMRVRSPQPAFWRGQTFADFDGQTWSVTPDPGRRLGGPIIDIEPTLGDASGGRVATEELVQTYYVETDLPNVVFAAPRPSRIIFDGSVWARPDGALRSDVTLTEGSVYTVVSERIPVTPESLRAQGDVGALFDGFRETPGGTPIEPFLRLPTSTSQRTIDLATALRSPGESTYDTISAYETWLGANTEYDLDAPVPAADADAVDDFLFESRLGFCEQIASTLAVMLRSQGVPTRLATGYVAGERDRVSGVWKVRASDAHAWVEVWFPESGWQPFDPTASVPLAGDVDAGTVGGDLREAALASLVSHRVEITMVAVAAVSLWMAVVGLRAMHRRRRRGRWGLLQDRFTALGDSVRPPRDVPLHPSPRDISMTNRAMAMVLDEPATAGVVADLLDRVAFDPSWVDDDEAYQRASSAMAALERPAR